MATSFYSPIMTPFASGSVPGIIPFDGNLSGGPLAMPPSMLGALPPKYGTADYIPPPPGGTPPPSGGDGGVAPMPGQTTVAQSGLMGGSPSFDPVKGPIDFNEVAKLLAGGPFGATPQRANPFGSMPGVTSPSGSAPTAPPVDAVGPLAPNTSGYTGMPPFNAGGYSMGGGSSGFSAPGVIDAVGSFAGAISPLAGAIDPLYGLLTGALGGANDAVDELYDIGMGSWGGEDTGIEPTSVTPADPPEEAPPEEEQPSEPSTNPSWTQRQLDNWIEMMIRSYRAPGEMTAPE